MFPLPALVTRCQLHEPPPSNASCAYVQGVPCALSNPSYSNLIWMYKSNLSPFSKSSLLPSEDLAADTEAGTGTEVGMETEMEALRYAHQCPAALRTTHRIPRHQRRYNHPVAVVATLKVIIIIIVV